MKPMKETVESRRARKPGSSRSARTRGTHWGGSSVSARWISWLAPRSSLRALAGWRRPRRQPDGDARRGRSAPGCSNGAAGLAAAAFVLALLGPASPWAGAAELPCQFVLGFKLLRDQIPSVVGECLEDEHHNPTNGDGLQRTTKGLLVWRKVDNFTAFTDGYRTWVAGPDGLQQRLNAERFAWERDPLIRPTYRVDAVFLGDSHFERWPIEAAFAPLRVSNRGISGQTSEEIAARLERDALAAQPRALVLIGGANDVMQNLPQARTEAALRSAIERARAAGVAVYVSTVPPVRGGEAIHADSLWFLNRRIAQLNDWIRASAPGAGAVVVDFHAALVDDRGELRFSSADPDGLHLSAEGYERLAAALAPALKRSGDGG